MNRIFYIFGLFVRDSISVTSWDFRFKFIIQNWFQLSIDCWLFDRRQANNFGRVKSPPTVSNFRAMGVGGRTFRSSAAERLSFTLTEGRVVLLIIIIFTFYFFFVFVPRTEVPLYITTRIFIPLIAFFFSTSPYTTATKSDHGPRQTTATPSTALSLSFVWRRIRNQRMTCNAATTVFRFNLNDCRSWTPRGLYNNVRSGRRFPHLSGKRSDVRRITTVQLCR